jgi:UDP-N-acetylmuramyl pentapeptide phosphotransferase/UDP-N-acetylglucosamine-1-phosphate transferase
MNETYSPVLDILQSGLAPAVILFCLAALATEGLTWLVRSYLLKHRVLDIPNERSSHQIPTPRGGGLAVSSVIIAGLIAVYFFCTTDLPGTEEYQPNYIRLYLPLIGSGLLLMAVSWIDDKRGLSPRVRLMCHLLAAAIGTLALPEESTVLGDLLPLWLDRLLTILGLALFMNIYNFMDGIDGITSAETLSITAGVVLVILMIENEAPDDFQDYLIRNLSLAVLVGGAAFGFMFPNWHPAKIFLGDVGSVPLGFFTGFLLIQIACSGYLVPALILPLYYVTDGGLTLMRRAIRGEKIWQAHRQHFYQRSAAAIGCHDKVVNWIARANIFLIAFALLAFAEPWAALVLALVAVSGLLSVMSKATIKK